MEEEWDGSDFFMIWPMPRRVFITKRVAAFLMSSNYSGIRVKQIATLRKAIAGGYSPGHIEDWFDGKQLAQVLRRFEDYL